MNTLKVKPVTSVPWEASNGEKKDMFSISFLDQNTSLSATGQPNFRDI